MTNRTKSTIFNLYAGLGYQAVTLISGFLVRKFFLLYIGVNYLGFDGFFNNIISMLMLLDFGVGVSSVFYLSRAFARKDTEEISEIYAAFNFLYKVIAVIMTIAGLIFSFNIQYFIDISSYDLQFIKLIFWLQYARTISNFLLSCPRIAMKCNQTDYSNLFVDILFAILFGCIKIGVIIVTGSYVAYLAIILLEIISGNLVIRSKFRTAFPYIKKMKLRLDKVQLIFGYAKKIVLNSLNDFVYRSTDNLIIAHSIGLKTVGFMSNYYYIYYAIEALTTQIFQSSAASVTNLLNDEESNSEKNVKNLLACLTFIAFVIALFCSVCLFGLSSQFIGLFYGQEYMLHYSIILCLVINLMITCFHTPFYIFIVGKGMASKEIKYALFMTFSNLLVSVFLVRFIGVQGVLIGTIVSNLIMLTGRGIIVNRNILHLNKNYVIDMIKYFITISVGLIVVFVFFPGSCSTYLEFILQGIFCVMLFAGLLLPFCKKNEFRIICNIICNKISKK